MDRSERDRAAMAQPLPIPFVNPLCVGFNAGSSINPRTLGECYRCKLWTLGRMPGADHSAIVTGPDGTPHCNNLRETMSLDQVAAVDEQAGLHAPTVRPTAQAGQSADLWGSDVQQHSGGVSK